MIYYVYLHSTLTLCFGVTLSHKNQQKPHKYVKNVTLYRPQKGDIYNMRAEKNRQTPTENMHIEQLKFLMFFESQ